MAINTKGIVLEYCATSMGTYVPLTPLLTLDVPKKESEKITITDLSSAFVVQMIGLDKLDDVSFELIHTPANLTTLASTLYGVSMYWKITLPDPTTPSTFAFQGWLSSLDCKGNKPNSEVKYECKITLTSEITYTAGS
jgi:hypothetical protein